MLKDGNMTELRVVWPGGSSSPANLVDVENKVNELIADRIDATVKFDILEWGVFGDQQNLLLSSGEDVSLMFTYSGTSNFANTGDDAGEWT